MTNDTLQGKKIALLATSGFEDSELMQPYDAVKSAGAQVTVISDTEGEINGKDGTTVNVDQLVDDVSIDDYDGLILPGGDGNPDKMRMNQKAVQFVRGFFQKHKPVAAICHAPWLLIEADVVKERKVTSWPSLKTDLQNAGAAWVDEEVVTDNGLVTSRKPEDLAAFCAKAIEEFAEGPHQSQTA
jgi:protease I